MFYKTQLKDHIRVSPKYFDLPTKEAVLKAIKGKYDGYIDQDVGVVIDVADIKDIGEGVIILGDGAVYYDTVFDILNFKPELKEVITGKIKDIADFGAFVTMGPIEGMVHISQTMDDFVSFAKDKVLSGKESGHMLKIGDQCRARVIAVSFKDIANPKIGLTMRQLGLGRIDWMDEAQEKQKKQAE